MMNSYNSARKHTKVTISEPVSESTALLHVLSALLGQPLVQPPRNERWERLVFFFAIVISFLLGFLAQVFLRQ
jgi:hypothetical protein